MKRLVSETVVYLRDFVREKRTEPICDGFVVFTLGQEKFCFETQDAVQFFPQCFRVVRVLFDDVGIKMFVCFVDSSVTFTDLPSQLCSIEKRGVLYPGLFGLSTNLFSFTILLSYLYWLRDGIHI